MTRKEAVLDVLKSRRWIAGYELTRPSVGGSEGLRRVRELRAEGYGIKMRKLDDSNVREYRLVSRP